ncbi:hypothetical protein HAX54_053289 [Datura stramonium]|uniref:Uncharacterized protein n=1 Tax=Datura stramonium TaxID=4076 RepID=A0ABS8T0R8_DATST|nr:hypothetical protein [Datura stramonium]
MVLRFFRTFIKYHHVILPDSLVKLTKNAKLVVKMLHRVFNGIPDECKTNLNLERIVSQLLKFIECNTSLRVLVDVPNQVINGKRLNEVLEKIGVLVGDMLCVIQMLLAGYTIKEDDSKIDHRMIQILEKIEDLKAEVEERYKSLNYSPSLFPTVGGLSFLDSLLRKLKEMLKSETSLDFMMKPHIRILEKELSSLTFVFRDVVKVQHKHDELLKDLQRRTAKLAYEAENFTKSHSSFIYDQVFQGFMLFDIDTIYWDKTFIDLNAIRGVYHSTRFNFTRSYLKMAQNDIDDVLDHLRRIKSRGDQSSIETDQIETLEMHLRFLRTFIKYHHVILPDFIVKIKKKAKLIVKKLHSVFGGIPDECKNNLILERLKSLFLEFIEGNTSSVCNFELNDDSDLSEYMDCLGNNLNDVLMCLELERSDPSSTNKQILLYNRGLKQVKIIQKKMRFLRYSYATEINGYVDHEKLDGLETQIQFMADNVGQFCLALFVNRDDTSTDEDEDDTNSDEDEDDIYIVVDEDEDDTSSDEDDILSKPPYLLCLIVLVELEMKKIFLGELKASKFSQSRTFKDKKLPKGFSYYLRNLLVYLRNEKLKNFPTDVTARNIDVAIEFLLFLLGDVPNHVINGNSLNEVLEKIGVLVGNILCLIQMLLVGSTVKEDTRKIELGTIQILEAQVEEVYKSLQYSPSNEFPIVGGLSFIDSLQRKLNEMLKSESSFDFMMKPHIGVLEK